MGNTDQSSERAGDISGAIHFLARIPLYDTVKPFDISYNPGNGLPASNFQGELHRVTVRDMRKYDLPYEQCGFRICSLDSAMKYEDYDHEATIKDVHFPEVESCVKEAMNASFVKIFNFSQRRRHPSFPIATGEAYEYEQPISRAHLDATFESAKNVIRDGVGTKADELFVRPWQFVNIWHPIRGPLYDWPLAVCDVSSVDFDADTMPGDSVNENGIYENIQVHFNDNQKWYYVAGQQQSELLIFKHADSQIEDGVPYGVPHASFNIGTSTDCKPEFLRESIEMAALVVW
ncbi:methyltransferase [Lophiotrema nucula]|uniref:Methyltransferase n=1 Tax=Lophiotrema nucula TaxID=690887 RepID=A0A6A5YNJ5_9PLEO|nr:methyltransferase [Lophiotrema nucula]